MDFAREAAHSCTMGTTQNCKLLARSFSHEHQKMSTGAFFDDGFMCDFSYDPLLGMFGTLMPARNLNGRREVRSRSLPAQLSRACKAGGCSTHEGMSMHFQIPPAGSAASICVGA